MIDKDTILLVMQAVSMGVSLTLSLLLILSHFREDDTTKVYRHVRMLLIAGTALLTLHYGLQMYYGFRLMGDDVGAVINILFYSPVVYIIAYSTVRIGCGPGYHRRHIRASIVSMALIIGCFIGGWFYYGSLHMKWAMYAMGLVFFISIIYFIIYPMKEMRRINNKMTEMSEHKTARFNQYMRNSNLFLDSAAIFVPFCIFHTPALALLGPFFLVALLCYIISFIDLGHDIQHIKNIINNMTEEE